MNQLPRLFLLAGALVLPFLASAQQIPPQPSPVAAIVPNRYIVVYRNGSIPAEAALHARVAGATLVRQQSLLGVAILQTDPHQQNDAATLSRLRSLPNVELVLHDRYVSASRLVLQQSEAKPAAVSVAPFPIVQQAAPDNSSGPALIPLPSRPGIPIHGPIRPVAPIRPVVPTPLTPFDTYYTSTPQAWAVQQVGGYGNNVAGGPAHGPWDITMGKGIRIAILDSGVDALHPDIAPNLGLNLSEVDQTALPSPCDDGTPQDQQGHGTWAASLAAAAMGSGTGLTIGVAPEATILNIKVLERMPAGDGSSPTTQCPAGEASGLLSWVIAGIEDAVTNHANIISLSLGTLVDLSTGDGAGLQATFNQITYAAAQQGAVLIAAAGNDGLDLTNPQYIELPAQSRDVLAIVASTNPACAQNVTAGALCAPGPVAVAYYSDFGAPLNALAAPGGSLPDGSDAGISGWIRGACSNGKPATVDGPPSDANHSYGCFNFGHTQYVQAMGTSASAPLAAGAAALLLAAHPTWSPATIIATLRSTATTLPTLAVPQINAQAALATQ